MYKFRMLSIFILILLFIVSLNLYSQIIKDDFRVNDDITGGANYYPAVELMGNGKAIIVWQDMRNGFYNIYGQAYDVNGNTVGANFKVNTYPASQYEYTPSISSYGDSLIVIWQYRYGQWLLSDGSQSGTTFTLQSQFMYSPDVAASDSGFFVVWYNFVSGSSDEIFLMRFDFSGDSINARILVNDDGTIYNQAMPKIAMDKDGNFVVVWRDVRNGIDYDIYGQLFNSGGNKVGSNFLINDDGASYYQDGASCAMDSSGNFVVVWYDNRGGTYDIYGQRFDPSGDTTGLGGNFLINDDVMSVHQYSPSCSMDKDGDFVVVWDDQRDGNGDVYGQLFDNMGNTLGSNFRIDQCPGTESQYDPEVSMNKNNFVVSWYDGRSYTSIYKRRFNNDGTPVENEVMVNDLEGTYNQNRSAIDMNTAGNVVVTWLDYRIPTGIYFQRLNILGDTPGENIRVDYGDDPDVTVANDSSFVITYQYSRTIYYQMFTLGGDSIGPPARASDTTYNYRYRPSIDINSSGNFVITWYDNRNGNFDIYAQRFDSIGDTIGVNFRIDDDLGTSEQSYPAVAVSSEGRFIITWHDYRNGDFDIFGQVYNAGGNPVGTNFKINTDVGTQGQFYPDVASLPDGNFIIVWQDYRSGMGIYGQIIDFLGIPVDANFKISDVVAYWPCVDASDTGRFVVTWHDYRDGNTNIYAQSFNPDYTPYKGNYKVNNDIEGLNQGQIYPDLVTDGTNIIFTWDDTKWQRGYDIAAKVVGWEFSSSIDDGEYVEIPTMLLPNIPNPFINSTLIRYQIDERQEIKIEIYDISGRLIRTLSSGIVEPGVHNLRWNGKDAEGKRVPAGIYFCRLSAGNRIQSRKMVMIK